MKQRGYTNRFQCLSYTLLVWVTLLCNIVLADDNDKLTTSHSLQHGLENHSSDLINQRPLEHRHTLYNLYRERQYKLLWLNSSQDQLSSLGQNLLDQLIETSADQLLDYRYHNGVISKRLSGDMQNVANVAALDMLLTDAFISYAEDVLSGSLLPTQPEAEPSLSISKEQLLSVLATDNPLSQPRIGSNPLQAILTQLAPPQPAYKRMRQALKQYRDLAPQWQPLASGPKLELGQWHTQVSDLRKLLIDYGDHPPAAQASEKTANTEVTIEQLFDLQLQQSLTQFQQRHGIKADGILGQESRAQLNIPPEQRIRQIALNMKRWRQLPRDLGERYIWVNLPDYRLDYVRADETELTMKVIIGRRTRQTPSTTLMVGLMVLNPHWNVPQKIANKDLLPLIKADPDYLQRHNMILLRNWESPVAQDPSSIDWATMNQGTFDYRIQQTPSADNALGRIKFITSSGRAIYLHDTGAKHLFDLNQRTLSSGCVRIEKPLTLARALLADNDDWDADKLQNSLDTGETLEIRLAEAVPTYLSYMTAWVDREGLLQFRKDIYRQDQRRIDVAKLALTATP